MLRRSFLLFLATALFVPPLSGQGLDLPPRDLRSGDSYRVLFVTTATIDAASDDVADYDLFVSTAAQAVPELAALGTNWRAVVSTPTIAAWDHTDTHGPWRAEGVPVYRPDGVRIVDQSSGLWRTRTAGPLLAFPEVTETGARVTNTYPWTGSNPEGLRHPGEELGSGGSARLGRCASTGYQWTHALVRAVTESHPVYGISDVLTVPDPTHPAGLPPGSRYRVLFVTDGVRDATSSDIAEYDRFVNDDANAVQNLRLLATSWRAVASTAAIDARSHTDTTGGTEGALVPVYRVDGALIAAQASDLWLSVRQPLLASPNLSASGNAPPNDRVWTGTDTGGRGYHILGGGGNCDTGEPTATSYAWVWANDLPASSLLPLYAISDVLVVPLDAQEVIRVGAAGNPDAFRPGATSGPVLGQTWDPWVDHSSFVPAAALDFALISPAPIDLPLSGVATGNLLCDPTFHLRMTTAPGTPFGVPCPNEPLLVGLALCVQGASLDAGSPAIHFANALDIVLGTR